MSKLGLVTILQHFPIFPPHQRNNSRHKKTKKKLNSVAWVRERTIPTERPRLSAKLVSTFADRGCHVVDVTIPTAVFSAF
jgi:hypothetical protein